jgi:hypothetical protein
MARLTGGANGVWRAAFGLYREKLGKSALTRGENSPLVQLSAGGDR